MEQSAPVSLWNDTSPTPCHYPEKLQTNHFRFNGAPGDSCHALSISLLFIYFLRARAFSNWWQLSTRNEPRAHIMMPHRGYPQSSLLPQTGCEARQEGLRSWKWAGPSRKGLVIPPLSLLSKSWKICSDGFVVASVFRVTEGAVYDR